MAGTLATHDLASPSGYRDSLTIPQTGSTSQIPIAAATIPGRFVRDAAEKCALSHTDRCASPHDVQG